MRNFDEFKEELLRRKAERKVKDQRKRRLIGSVCIALCLVLLVGLVLQPTTKVQALNLMKGIYPQWVSGKEPDETFRAAQYEFALELFKACRAANREGNTLVSPLSLMLALSMTANGADGETLAQMEDVLGMPIEQLNAYLKTYVNQLPNNWRTKLHIANSIWFREGLEVNQDFLQTNANYYGANAYASPFDAQTMKDINTWVGENTDGMIDKIIEEIGPNDVLYLVNAMYFDAKWDGEKPKTIGDKFRLADGTVQNVTMMNTTAQYYLQMDNATGFLKDYAGGDYRFVALLPNTDVSLEEFVSNLTTEQLREVLDNAQTKEVGTKIPEFSCDKSFSMKQVLWSMGIMDAFTGGLADFSAMIEEDGYISDVTQKTHITINADGTKAAASTVATNTLKGEIYDHTVRLNRPFLYMIVDSENNLPLFIGTVDYVD